MTSVRQVVSDAISYSNPANGLATQDQADAMADAVLAALAQEGIALCRATLEEPPVSLRVVYVPVLR